MPNASVVIPTRNGLDYLPDCLASLERQTLPDIEVIVVDNGSTDSSRAYLAKAYPWVRTIFLEQNFGFAAACNIGIEASRGRFVALLNNDARASPDWLEHLVLAADLRPRIGMVASKILSDLETRTIDSAGMLIYPDGIGRQRGRGQVDSGQFDGATETLFPSGCAALFRREMLADIGLFDEDFFAYCEDTDLGLRGVLAGWEAVLAPRAEVHHLYSKTVGAYTTFKAFHVERNRIWVSLKTFPPSWLSRMPAFTVVRYAVQMYGLVSSRGATARMHSQVSFAGMLKTLARAYGAALAKTRVMLARRKQLPRRIAPAQLAGKMKAHRVPVTELILED
ncbi:MAG: glycosyltransferase family 2 protein [Thermoanaerobaculia bacterium]